MKFEVAGATTDMEAEAVSDSMDLTIYRVQRSKAMTTPCGIPLFQLTGLSK